MEKFNFQDNKNIQDDMTLKDKNIQKSNDDLESLKKTVNSLTMALVMNGIDVENL